MASAVGVMLALLQRVSEANVRVDGDCVGAIERGWLVLVCAEPDDSATTVTRMLEKILKLRAFPDAAGKMNLSVCDVGGGLLLVSQFTLAADTRSGTRPSFSGVASPAIARALFAELVQQAKAQHSPVASGVFAADMKVALVNDGPVTLWIKVDGVAR
jgi:D-aminoacyl-tRNA deacylase